MERKYFRFREGSEEVSGSPIVALVEEGEVKELEDMSGE